MPVKSVCAACYIYIYLFTLKFVYFSFPLHLPVVIPLFFKKMASPHALCRLINRNLRILEIFRFGHIKSENTNQKKRCTWSDGCLWFFLFSLLRKWSDYNLCFNSILMKCFYIMSPFGLIYHRMSLKLKVLSRLFMKFLCKTTI